MRKPMKLRTKIVLGTIGGFVIVGALAPNAQAPDGPVLPSQSPTPTVTQTVTAEPSESLSERPEPHTDRVGPRVDADVHRPRSCAHRWYC
jgi:hypothetical protein